jgi:glycosyltransferase involved in cell wall biosynthesis
MLEGLSKDFSPVLCLCLGDESLPSREVMNGSNGVVAEVHRFAGHRCPDLLDRATAFAQFVEEAVVHHAGTVERIVFRDPWGGFPALRALPGCRSIFEVNALPSWELHYSRPGLAASATLAAKLGDLERYCLRHAERILCVSSVTRRALAADFGVDPARVSVLPNSAADLYFDVPARESRHFAYVGGLQPWQGVETVVDAFAMVPATDAKLRVIHSGNRGVRDLDRRITRYPSLRHKVSVEDPLAPGELASAFAGLRFTVAPLTDTPRNTWQGCCPIKIVESMAAGTPVLASDLEVTRELIRHGEDGWLAPPGDVRAWAGAIERLLADDALRNRLANGAKHTARQRFSRRSALDQLSRILS